MNRRNFISNSGKLSAGLILTSGPAGIKTFMEESSDSKESEKKTEMEVTAIEDLMREHGILRRILFVYSETAGMLRQEPTKPISEPLHEAAKLFRDFGENYHEKALEEAFIFPAISKAGLEALVEPEIFISQHQKGQIITDFILAATKEKESIKESKDVQQLISSMETFVRMYRPHAAREDTIVFPAWKQTLSREQFNELSEKFEDIEHEQFGEGGFDKAVSQITAIEKQLGLSDLSQFTPKALPI